MNTGTWDHQGNTHGTSDGGSLQSGTAAWCANHKGLLVILASIVLVLGIGRCSAVSERNTQERKRLQELESYRKEHENYRKAISAALQADHQASNGVTGKICVERYEAIVRNMAAIDLRGCPQQFADAYRKHVEAWRKTIPLIRRAENLNGWGNILGNFFIGALAGYTGFWELIGGKVASDSQEADEIKAQARQVDEAISSTYKEVLRIADTYRVDTSSYRAKQ